MTTNGARRSAEARRTEVVLGVDTHLDFHVAVVLDHLGRRLGEAKTPTTTKGYRNLLSWAEGFGPVGCAGVEGTGSYGAGLARHLKAAGIAVMEVERPKRRHLPRRGKSDPIDAERAARAVLAGQSAARVQAVNLLKAMLVTAPEVLRWRSRALPTGELVAVAARFRLGGEPEDVEAATRFALRSVARRYPRHSPKRSRSWTRSSSGWWRKRHPGSSPWRASARTTPPHCSSWPETTPRGSGARHPSPLCAGSRPWKRLPATWSATGLTVAATGTPTGRFTWSAW